MVLVEAGSTVVLFTVVRTVAVVVAAGTLSVLFTVAVFRFTMVTVWPGRVTVARFWIKVVAVLVTVEAFSVVVLPMDFVSVTVTMEVTAGIVLVDNLVKIDVMASVTVAAFSDVVFVVMSVTYTVATGRVVKLVLVT